MKTIILTIMLFIAALTSAVCFSKSTTPEVKPMAYYVSDIVMPLWEESIPNTLQSDEKEIVVIDKIIRISKVQTPTIEVFLPQKDIATGQAVVILPGGGYRKLAYDWEGQNIAKWLNSKGIAGIVVKYRLPDSTSIKIKYEAPLMDAKRAMQLTRLNADAWNIKTNNIGIMGFSAGGHLASTLGTQFDKPTHKTTLPSTIDNISNRPDFMILMYPVISMMKKDTHMGSRNSLLGKSPNQSLIKQYSNHLQVKDTSPPTFILHASDDNAVPVENSLEMYRALKSKNIPVSLHIFQEGGHGFALSATYKPLAKWPNLLHQWLQTHNK